MNPPGVDPVPLGGELPPEQARYAAWLRVGAMSGLVVMLLGFAAYVLEIGPTVVRPAMLPQWWSLSAAEFARVSGMPTGWGWLARLRHGDMAALMGIAVLAGCSLPGLIALAPLYLRRRDRAYVALCLAEAAVIVLAASGWLNGGR